jgi:AraC-like DNA-binding protein
MNDPQPLGGLADAASACAPWRRAVGPLELRRGLATTLAFDADSLLRRWAVVLPEGRLDLRQAGRGLRLEPGEWTLVRTGPGLALDSQSPLCLAALPAEWSSDMSAPLLRALMRRFDRTCPTSRMAHGVFTALFDAAGEVREADGAELAQAALHVLKSALRSQAEHHRLRTTLLDRVQGFIAWHVRDPSLSVSQIARAVHCSPRQVHRAFGGERETVALYILRRRLEGCRNDLADAAQRDRSVTEIAFSWGFNNAAHFSRVFKREFGRGPRSFRNAL